MAGKKGGASMAAPKERVDQELENTPTTSKGFNVKIDKLFDDETKSIRAAASLNIGGFAVHGIRVFEKDDQLWVSMPQNSYKNANGEVKYDDVFHPVTAEARKELHSAVLAEYQQALENSQAAVTTTAEETTEVVQKM
jgi:stage V sporulation protein G